MGKILILEDVIAEAFKSEQESFALFGKTNIIKTPSTTYDFIFHFIRGIDIEKLVPDEYMKIPVFIDNSKEKVKFHNLFRKNRYPNICAFKDNKPATLIKGNVEFPFIGRSLSFYHAEFVHIGTYLIAINEYTPTTEEECRRILPDFDEYQKRLQEVKNEIDRKYISHAA